MTQLSGCLYGKVLRKNLVAGLTLTETSYAADLRLPKHAHDEAYFCFVLKGGYTENYGRRSRSCTPSTLIFHPSDEIHSDQFYAAARCFNIQMNALWQERARQYSLSLNHSVDFRGGLLLQLAMRLYGEFHSDDACSPLVVEGLALEMMGEACRPVAGKSVSLPPRWLLAARDLLHEKFTESLSLPEMADSVGVHPVHLAREFRRFYRCTIGEYARQLRIDFACRKITASDMPLSEIALAAGFFDQSHFTRTFKACTGRTPQEYRSLFSPR
jgi:AraC family transcriptional regulator